ncbi:MAG: hypothetical protein ACO1N7_07895, partial [Sphingobacteriaceae bacterium]
FANVADPYKRRLIDGYTLVNASAGYTWKDRFTFFTKVENALDKRYRSAITVDLNDNNSPQFHGALQDPLRVMAGFSYRFQ